LNRQTETDPFRSLGATPVVDIWLTILIKDVLCIAAYRNAEAEIDMKNIQVTSRMIESVYFSQEDGQLRLRFRNGEERCFTGVPESEAIALCNSHSPGQHYIDHIRAHFTRRAA